MLALLVAQLRHLPPAEQFLKALAHLGRGLAAAAALTALLPFCLCAWPALPALTGAALTALPVPLRAWPALPALSSAALALSGRCVRTFSLSGGALPGPALAALLSALGPLRSLAALAAALSALSAAHLLQALANLLALFFA